MYIASRMIKQTNMFGKRILKPNQCILQQECLKQTNMFEKKNTWTKSMYIARRMLKAYQCILQAEW